MNILFITSAHNSLSQRLLLELHQRGHSVAVGLATSDEAMDQAVSGCQPELIIAPMLKRAIPERIWQQHVCLIVHPGIVGDRGPSSLDWAIAEGKTEWGVTVLQAVAEMDAGPIWASHTFKLDRTASKSSLYHNEVTEAAVKGVLEAVDKFVRRDFTPQDLDYSNPTVKGCLLPMMKQADRRINWQEETTAEITRKIHAADSNPGVLDSICGEDYYLYGAHAEEQLKGSAGSILAHRDGAVLRGTVDGAVWITHLKARSGPHAGIKLPAYWLLQSQLPRLAEVPLAAHAVHSGATFREIEYRQCNQVGYLYFNFYNGAMSTDQCRRLYEAYSYARFQPTKVLVLFGGYDYFSNGIHLNVIEAADSPADESWANINAIDDIVQEILHTQSQITIAALRGNAGAGGVMLALAADYVFARQGVVLNPHYKGMGGLYGSEYWTYTLPRRVGKSLALTLTEECQPIGTRHAVEIGLLDDHFGHSVEAFERQIVNRAECLAERPDGWQALAAKHRRLRGDESQKPLAVYRNEELAKMRQNFYGADRSYHKARHNFVFKQPYPATPSAETTAQPVAQTGTPGASWKRRWAALLRRDSASVQPLP